MIIIPIAGKSTRFFQTGYREYKFLLPFNNKSILEHILFSFEKYFKIYPFIIIIRKDFDDLTKNKIISIIKNSGILDWQIVEVFETRGQAETVYEGIKDHNINTPLYIWNGDTIRLIDLPIIDDNVDGLIEVFVAEGSQWSFANIDEDLNVLNVAEKKRISPYCSSGLYYFKSIEIYKYLYDLYISEEDIWYAQEPYIAPMYNKALEINLKIKGSIKDFSDFIFCGNPKEYEDVTKKKQTK